MTDMLAQIPLSEFSILVINKSPAIGAADCWSAPKEAPVFARLARFLIRHRRPVLVAAGVFFVVAGALGGTVADHLSRGGFDDPRAESVIARRRLEREFGAGLPAYVLVVTPTTGALDDPAVADRARHLTSDLAGELGVADAVSGGTTGAPDLRGRGNRGLGGAFLPESHDQPGRAAA